MISRRDFLKLSGASVAAIYVATRQRFMLRAYGKTPQPLLPLPGMQENCACNECPYMKLNTLEKLYAALRDETPEITMTEELRQKAEAPLLKMLEWSTQIGKNA